MAESFPPEHKSFPVPIGGALGIDIQAHRSSWRQRRIAMPHLPFLKLRGPRRITGSDDGTHDAPAASMPWMLGMPLPPAAQRPAEPAPVPRPRREQGQAPAPPMPPIFQTLSVPAKPVHALQAQGAGPFALPQPPGHGRLPVDAAASRHGELPKDGTAQAFGAKAVPPVFRNTVSSPEMSSTLPVRPRADRSRADASEPPGLPYRAPEQSAKISDPNGFTNAPPAGHNRLGNDHADQTMVTRPVLTEDNAALPRPAAYPARPPAAVPLPGTEATLIRPEVAPALHPSPEPTRPVAAGEKPARRMLPLSEVNPLAGDHGATPMDPPLPEPVNFSMEPLPGAPTLSPEAAPASSPRRPNTALNTLVIDRPPAAQISNLAVTDRMLGRQSPGRPIEATRANMQVVTEVIEKVVERKLTRKLAAVTPPAPKRPASPQPEARAANGPAPDPDAMARRMVRKIDTLYRDERFRSGYIR